MIFYLFLFIHCMGLPFFGGERSEPRGPDASPREARNTPLTRRDCCPPGRPPQQSILFKERTVPDGPMTKKERLNV